MVKAKKVFEDASFKRIRIGHKTQENTLRIPVNVK